MHLLSKHRAALMGLAIIIIVLFHVGQPRVSALYGLCRMGNVGVDIFLFLSGIGLWFSWTKASQSPPYPPEGGAVRRWLRFYLRRLRRVYPSWLVVALLFYVPRSHGLDLWGDVLINWDFWLHDELTFWYVPATMMLYLFAPLYMELLLRDRLYAWLPAMAALWCVCVQYVTPIHQAVGHIEIFWSRVPIFLLGINCGEAVMGGVLSSTRNVSSPRVLDSTPPTLFRLAAICALLSLAACVWLEQMRHGRFPLFLERFLYIPLAIGLALTAARLLDRLSLLRGFGAGFYRALTFLGGISLEIYLIHAEFVMKPLRAATPPFGGLEGAYWPTVLLTLALTVPLAWLLAKLSARFCHTWQKRPKSKTP